MTRAGRHRRRADRASCAAISTARSPSRCATTTSSTWSSSRSGPAAARTRSASRRPPACTPIGRSRPCPARCPRCSGWPGSPGPWCPSTTWPRCSATRSPSGPAGWCWPPATPPLGLAFHDVDGHIRVEAGAIVAEAAGNGRRGSLRGMVTLPGGGPADRRRAGRPGRRAHPGRARPSHRRGDHTMMAGRTFGAKLAAGFGLTLALTLLMTATSVLALRYVLVTQGQGDPDGEPGAGRLDGAEPDHGDAGSATTGRTCSAASSRVAGHHQPGPHRPSSTRSAGCIPPSRIRSPPRQLDVVSAAEARHAVLLDGGDGEARQGQEPDRRQSVQRPEPGTGPHGAAGRAQRADRPGSGPTSTPTRKESSARATGAIIFIIGHRRLADRHAPRRWPGGSAGTCAARWAPRSGTSRARRRELEAAAAQQATGGREQATAMSEITTTISELLTTSRQIADSAQRVLEDRRGHRRGGPHRRRHHRPDPRPRSPRSAPRST